MTCFVSSSNKIKEFHERSQWPTFSMTKRSNENRHRDIPPFLRHSLGGKSPHISLSFRNRRLPENTLQETSKVRSLAWWANGVLLQVFPFDEAAIFDCFAMSIECILHKRLKCVDTTKFWDLRVPIQSSFDFLLVRLWDDLVPMLGSQS